MRSCRRLQIKYKQHLEHNKKGKRGYPPVLPCFFIYMTDKNRRPVSKQLPVFYFSVQNSTFSPLRIIFVVRTAHIFPHMEQV